MQTSEVGSSVNTLTMCLGGGLDTQEWFRGGGGLGNFNFPQNVATKFTVLPAFYQARNGISCSGSKSNGVRS